MEVTISGLDQVRRKLDELPRLVSAEILARALDRAAGVIQAEVEQRVPEKEGVLQEAIKVQVSVDVQRRGGTADIGFSSQQQNEEGVPADVYASWVEFGHRLVGHQPGKKQLGTVQPHPFMRPAFDSSRDHAIEVFTQTLLDGLSEATGENE